MALKFTLFTFENKNIKHFSFSYHKAPGVHRPLWELKGDAYSYKQS